MNRRESRGGQTIRGQEWTRISQAPHKEVIWWILKRRYLSTVNIPPALSIYPSFFAASVICMKSSLNYVKGFHNEFYIYYNHSFLYVLISPNKFLHCFSDTYNNRTCAAELCKSVNNRLSYDIFYCLPLSFLLEGCGPDWCGPKGDYLDFGSHGVQQHQRQGGRQVQILDNFVRDFVHSLGCNNY